RRRPDPLARPRQRTLVLLRDARPRREPDPRGSPRHRLAEPRRRLRVLTTAAGADGAAATARQRDFVPMASLSFLSAVTFAVFDAGRALNTVGSPVKGFVP